MAGSQNPAGRPFTSDAKRKFEEQGITDLDEKRKISRQMVVQRQKETRRARRIVEYAEHREHLQHQLRNRPLPPTLLPPAILDEIAETEPDAVALARPSSTRQATSATVGVFEPIPPSGDSRRGDIEDHAREAGAQQEVFPPLESERRLSHAQDDDVAYPDQYFSDDEPALPDFDALESGRHSPPLSSPNDSPARPGTPSSPSHISAIPSHDPLYVYASSQITPAVSINPPTTTTSLSTIDQGPSTWPYSTQLNNPRPSRDRSSLRTVRVDYGANSQAEPDRLRIQSQETFDKAWTDGDASEMLLQHLHHFQGCTKEQHRETLDKHNTDLRNKGATHTRLAKVGRADLFPSALSASKFVSYRDVDDKCMQADNLCLAFEGRQRLRDGELDRPIYVCVHASDAKTPEQQHCTTSFDCDSHCGWPISFAAFREGVTAFFLPPKTSQMQSDLHLPTSPRADSVFDPDMSAFLKLDDTTHIFFGQAKALSADVYIYFPHIHNPSTLLTEEQFTLWTNRILIPALHQSGAKDAHSSYPVSYESSKYRAFASQTEGRSREPKKTYSAGRVEYTIDAQACSSLWENIKSIINDGPVSPDLAIFAGAQLFFSAKNTKYQDRVSDLLQCLDDFNNRLDHAYNFDYIDCMLIDVGKETTSADTAARTAFFRDCCVRNAVTNLFANAERKYTTPSKCMSQYHHFGTRDLKNFTATPPADSIFAEEVLYAQWYSQIKQRLDTQKTYPFADDSYKYLAVGEQLFNAQKSAGKANVEYKATQEAFCSSAQRIHHETLSPHSDVAHSAREEFRMTLTGFHRLRAAARRKRDSGIRADQNSSALGKHATALWLLPTKEVLYFIWRISNSRVAWIQNVLALVDNNPSPEQTRVILMMIQSLQMFMQGTNIPSRREHWIHVVPDAEKCLTRMGAGFSKTMMEYGFCWLNPIVDWSRHVFLLKCREYMLFNSETLLARYKKRRPEVVELTELWDAVNTCHAILVNWQHKDIHRLVLEALVEFVLRQFREDIRDTIRTKDFTTDVQNRVNDLDAPLDYEKMRRLYGKDLCLIGRERAVLYSKSPETLLERFFGDLPQPPDGPASTRGRDHFHQRPYRKLAWNITQMLERSHFIAPHARRLGGSAFQTYLRLACLRIHNILPCPSPGCTNLTETSKENKAKGKKSERQWITISRKNYPLETGIADYVEPGWWYRLGGPVDPHPIHENPWKGKTPQAITAFLIAIAEIKYGRRHGIGRGINTPSPSSDGDDE